MIDGGAPMLADLAIGAMETIPLQSSEALLPEDLNVSFKLLPAIIVIGMMGLFIVAGFMFQVDTDDMWVAGRSIGNIENGWPSGPTGCRLRRTSAWPRPSRFQGSTAWRTSSAGRRATSSC